MDYKQNTTLYSGAGKFDLSNILVVHAVTCAGIEGFFIRRSSLCMLTQYTKRIAPFYVFFAAVFLSVIKEHEINSSYCGLGNPGNVFHGDNLVSMHT